jgi:putative ABC transport system permease protein
VILNQNLARRLFGSADPVGHVLRFPDNRDVGVVGVARNSKYATLGEENAMALYAPYSQQRNATFAHFFVRTRGTPEATVRKVDETLGNLDSAFAVEVWAMRDIFAGALMPSRVGAGVLGSLAIFGLLLASIGLYGVLLYAICQRTREIGIRVALGAAPGNVLAMVVGQSSRLVAVGMLIGLAVAVVAVRPLSMLLVPEVSPADPMNFVLVACMLALVAALATLPPTARALRVDPAVALRHE